MAEQDPDRGERREADQHQDRHLESVAGAQVDVIGSPATNMSASVTSAIASGHTQEAWCARLEPFSGLEALLGHG